MSYDIGPKIGIEGEAEFKKAIAQVNTSLKTLGTEMKAVTSAYDKNDASAEKLSKVNDILTKRYGDQEAKVEMLKSRLAEAKAKYDENDASVVKLQQDLNLATADMNKTGLQIKQNNAVLEENAKASDKAGDGIDDAGEAAESSGGKFEKLGSVLKGVGIGMAAVVVAAGAAAIKLGKEVVQQFAELEQNLGGSEAVFGQYAANIQKSGEDAYKNLGVSQSDYLATANKMGALFQGSGLTQQKSLDLTTQAMQRAADMASVMGIDMQVALDSVAGAAKGNFTMMDNLGVSMNATSIEAYAAGKGLDFVYSKATQAEKAEMAMQMFFDNTTQYAGNFAREATETVSGSIGMLKAALGSFTAGLGNADADMKNLTQNMVDAFSAVVKNITPIIKNLVTALPAAMDGILPAIAGLLPMLLETATSLLRQMIDAIVRVLPELIPVAVDAILTIVDALIDNLPLLINAALQVIVALATGLARSLPELIPSVVEAVITIVETLIDNVDMLIDAAIEIQIALANGLIEALPKLLEKAPEIVIKLVKAIIENVPKMLEAAVALMVQLSSGIASGFGEILGKVGGWIDANILQPIKDKVSSFVTIGGDLIKGVWQGISDKATWLWNQVSGFFTNLTDRIKNFFGIESPSKLFRDEIGANLASGIGVGFEKQMKSVTQQMNASIPTSFDSPALTTANAVSGAVNGMAALMGAQGGGSYTINVVLPDGKALASVVFDPLKGIAKQRGVALA